MSKVLVGIDLGTTNTVCCRFDNSLEFIKFRGKELLPSVMYYRDGKVIVGDAAKKKAITYPGNVVMSSKTFIGDDNKIWTIQDQSFSPTDVATHVLSEVVKEVKKAYGVEECAAVITVPAYFTSKQYRETERAAETAGIEVIEILPEPVAAAIAYGMDEDESQDIFVIDLGGGTFDVSILSIEENEFTTVGVDGDRQLGGDDFDRCLVEMCMKQLRKEHGINLSSQDKSGLEENLYEQVMRKLQFECEKAKVELSAMEETDIIIPSLIPKQDSAINFQMHVSRDEFNEQCEELLDRIEEIINRCLEESDYNVTDIDKVILVGGSSNILSVRELVQKVFGVNPYSDKDLSKLVAIGAAIKATGDKTLIKDKKIHVTNILAHSFGIRVVNDRYSIIIPKGTKYPCKKSENYTTVSDDQESVAIKIYEGEDENNINNDYYYDEYEHTDIERNFAGVPQIKVTFEFDQNRVLHVSSEDQKTKSSGSKTIRVK
ncbi:Hsp70 family protein [Clostridium sp. HCP1S3_B4]|uniref:Hsp70 family protein n=1 Tax=unclassified Clostridium TaxID=2614128 RepID=UPI003F8CAB8C